MTDSFFRGDCASGTSVGDGCWAFCAMVSTLAGPAVGVPLSGCICKVLAPAAGADSVVGVATSLDGPVLDTFGIAADSNVTAANVAEAAVSGALGVSNGSGAMDGSMCTRFLLGLDALRLEGDAFAAKADGMRSTTGLGTSALLTGALAAAGGAFADDWCATCGLEGALAERVNGFAGDVTVVATGVGDEDWAAAAATGFDARALPTSSFRATGWPGLGVDATVAFFAGVTPLTRLAAFAEFVRVPFAAAGAAAVDAAGFFDPTTTVGFESTGCGEL